jgi:hypothetical protein
MPIGRVIAVFGLSSRGHKGGGCNSYTIAAFVPPELFWHNHASVCMRKTVHRGCCWLVLLLLLLLLLLSVPQVTCSRGSPKRQVRMLSAGWLTLNPAAVTCVYVPLNELSPAVPQLAHAWLPVHHHVAATRGAACITHVSWCATHCIRC